MLIRRSPYLSRYSGHAAHRATAHFANSLVSISIVSNQGSYAASKLPAAAWVTCISNRVPKKPNGAGCHNHNASIINPTVPKNFSMPAPSTR